MKPDPPPSPPALPEYARRLFLVIAAPLLFAWGGGVAHPILDWASVPGAWVAGLPTALGSVGVVAVFVATGALIATRIAAHPRIHRRLATTLAGAGAVATLAVLASGAAASRPASWLPVLLALGLLSRRGDDDADAWRVPLPWLPFATPVLWVAATRVRPWGDGLLGTRLEDALASVVNATTDGVIPLLPLIPVALVVGLLARRSPPRPRGAVVGLVLALALEKMFGFGAHWISAAAIGALFGAWPPELFGATARGRPLVLLAAPLLAALVLAGTRLGFTERWNCYAPNEATNANPEYRWPNIESDGVSMAVVSSVVEAFVVVRRDGRMEKFVGKQVASETTVEPPGGVLVTPPVEGMPIARLVAIADGLRVEWWDAGSLQKTAGRDLDVECTPVRGAMEVGANRVWAVCDDEDRIVIVGPGEEPMQLWDVDGRPRDVQLGEGAVVGFFSGPAAHAEVRRFPALADEVARRRVGPWSEGVTAQPGVRARAAVARGPAGHLEVFGAPSGATPTTLPEVLASALDRRVDTVRVGTWPGLPYAVRIGEPRNERARTGRGRHDTVIVTSPVDARVTYVDLGVLWHQRSVPVGAPLRSTWADPTDGTLWGMNRCGVFNLRVRTTFPWDP